MPSLKESAYKALHPIICEYVSFKEAEITPFTDGMAKVELSLKSGLSQVTISASWRVVGDFFLTSAAATM